ncbi:MAG: ketoacyl-ACP synthase III [Spirochaetes bacterium]|nr:ketoacyl-ACP synthase III [Spirochaetota bacterium]
MFEARITGVGSYLPSQIVDNVALYGKISGFDPGRCRESFAKRGDPADGLNDAQVFDRWVKQVSGIAQRHVWSDADAEAFPKKDLYDRHRHCEIMAANAAEAALAQAGIDRSAIDTVIFATVTSDTIIPNPGVILAHLLGLGEVATITTNTACSGFLDALGDAYARVRSGLSKCVLLATGEQFSGRMRYDDPTTAILFGDGAAVCLVERCEEASIRSWWAGSRYSNNITMGYGEPIVMGGGPLVQKNAVNAMATAGHKALELAGVGLDQIHAIVPHQANVRILIELARKLGVPPEKVAMPIDKMANISCATIPTVLDWYKRGLLPTLPYKPGALVLSVSVGGGYAYTGSVFAL